jgi:hypothetical protein
MMKSRSIAALFLAALLAGCGAAPTPEKVTEALKPIMPPNYTVNSVTRLGAIDDVYEVVVAIDKQPTVLYIDKKLKHVISGSIVEIASKKNLTYETQMKNRPGGAQPAAPAPAAQQTAPAAPVKK